MHVTHKIKVGRAVTLLCDTDWLVIETINVSHNFTSQVRKDKFREHGSFPMILCSMVIRGHPTSTGCIKGKQFYKKKFAHVHSCHWWVLESQSRKCWCCHIGDLTRGVLTVVFSSVTKSKWVDGSPRQRKCNSAIHSRQLYGQISRELLYFNYSGWGHMVSHYTYSGISYSSGKDK